MDSELTIIKSDRKIKFIVATVFSCIFGLCYSLYCMQVMVELPHLTWFDQIPLAETFFEGRLTAKDLFSRYGEHGLFATNILWLINCSYFGGSTLFDVVLNDINVFLCGIIVLYGTAITIKSTKVATISMFMEAIFMFTCLQNSSGGMETQVRLGILFFLIAMIFVDRELRNDKTNKWTLTATIVVILISINVFGTLYSFAGVPLVWLIVVLQKKKKKNHIIIAVFYLVTILLYILQYSWDFPASDASGGGFLEKINPLNILFCVFAWCGNGVLGWAYHEAAAYNAVAYMIIGAIVFVAIAWSVVLFFKSKMNEKTWLPLMMIVYSFGVLAMVYLGRSSEWQWMQNDWYNVHVKTALAGAIWIFGYYIANNFESISRKSVSFVASIFLPSVMVVLSVYGNFFTLKRAPHVHNYYAEKQQYLFVQSADDMPVDSNGNTPLLHSLDKTMQGIKILRKYNLSVYRYWDAYQESLPIEERFVGASLSDCAREQGLYDDGWVSSYASLWIQTGQKGLVHLKGWYGRELTGEEKITVYCNGIEAAVYTVTSDMFEFDIPVSPDSIVKLEIKTNFCYPPSNLDERNLAFVLNDLYGS